MNNEILIPRTILLYLFKSPLPTHSYKPNHPNIILYPLQNIPIANNQQYKTKQKSEYPSHGVDLPRSTMVLVKTKTHTICVSTTSTPPLRSTPVSNTWCRGSTRGPTPPPPQPMTLIKFVFVFYDYEYNICGWFFSRILWCVGCWIRVARYRRQTRAKNSGDKRQRANPLRLP